LQYLFVKLPSEFGFCTSCGTEFSHNIYEIHHKLFASKKQHHFDLHKNILLVAYGMNNKYKPNSTT